MDLKTCFPKFLIALQVLSLLLDLASITFGVCILCNVHGLGTFKNLQVPYFFIIYGSLGILITPIFCFLVKLRYKHSVIVIIWITIIALIIWFQFVLHEFIECVFDMNLLNGSDLDEAQVKSLTTIGFSAAIIGFFITVNKIILVSCGCTKVVMDNRYIETDENKVYVHVIEK